MVGRVLVEVEAALVRDGLAQVQEVDHEYLGLDQAPLLVAREVGETPFVQSPVPQRLRTTKMKAATRPRGAGWPSSNAFKAACLGQVEEEGEHFGLA